MLSAIELYNLNDKTIGEKAKWLREHKTHNNSKRGYMNSQELADDIGISSSTLNKLEKGGDCNLKTITEYANYFGVSIDWLCGNSKISDTTYDVHFIHKYTGLTEGTIKLLKKQNDERKNNKWLKYDSHYELLEKIVKLSFDKLVLSINSYIYTGDELKRGIEGYKFFIEDKRKKAIELSEKAKSLMKKLKSSDENNYTDSEISVKIQESYPEINEFYLNFADDIIDCENENIRNDLNALNSELFELQDTFISFIKGLSNIDELKDECYQLINDNSVFNDIHKMFSDIYQIDNTTKEGESNEEKES